MPHKPAIHSEYLEYVLNPKNIKRFLRTAIHLLKPYNFQAFAFRGISGALIAPILAYAMHKTLIVVRKNPTEESTHALFSVEGDLNAERYLVVDDFMCSGSTVQTILQDISAFSPDARCIGALFYRGFIEYGETLKITTELRLPDSLAHLVINPEQFKKIKQTPKTKEAL